MDDAVGVDIKGHFDLRDAAGSRRDPGQLEVAEGLVVGCHFTLALQHMHLNGGLAVGGGGEDLGLLGGDGGVALDDLGHHAAQGLNAQGQRGNIQQQQALYITGKNTALQCGAEGYALIGVDALEGLLAHEALNGLLDGGNTGGAAYQQHLADIGRLQARIGEGIADGTHGGFHQVGGQLIEFRTGDGHIKVLGAGGIRRDEGQVHIGLGHAGKVAFCLFGRFLQALQGHLILTQVDAVGLLEVIGHVVEQTLIEVIAAEVVVAGGRQNLLYAVAHFDDGNIEGAAAEVVDHDLLLAFLIDAVGKGSRSRLIDDTLDLQTGNLAGVLGGLTLGIGEVGGNGDDRFGDLLAQIGFCIGLQLLQDHCGDFLRGVLLAVNVHLVVGAHVALDGRNGLIGVGDGLALCHLAYQPLIVFECYNRGGGTCALAVGDDDGFAAFHNCYAGIGGTKVDADNLTHNLFLPNITLDLDYLCELKLLTDSVGLLHHGVPQDAVSAAVAALEHLRHHILTKAFILDVHDGIVQVGVEGVAGLAEGFHAHPLEVFLKAGLDHPDAGDIAFIGTGGLQRSLQVIQKGQQLLQGIGHRVGVDVIPFLLGAAAVVIVLGHQAQVSILQLLLFGLTPLQRLGFLALFLLRLLVLGGLFLGGRFGGLLGHQLLLGGGGFLFLIHGVSLLSRLTGRYSGYR